MQNIFGWKTVISTLSLTAALVSGCGQSNSSNNQASTTSPTTSVNQWTQEPAMTIDVHKNYSAVIHTNYGDFSMKLFANETPHMVNNFVFLAQHHFYNNCKFFRIIKTFMVQTGDPSNNGTGGPGYNVADELPIKHPYAPGIVAMAHSQLPNSNGSQFFICTGADSESLNSQATYTEIGQITSGMNVVQAIASIPVVQNVQTGEASSPTKEAKILSIDIHSN